MPLASWVLLFVAITQVFAVCPPNVTTNCNDGNNIDGDGCSRFCQIEDGWRCPANETLGDCVCYCVQPGQKCGCNWASTGSGAPLPRMIDFDRVGVAFTRTQSKFIMQGFRFERSGCNKVVDWTQGYKGEPGSNGVSACPGATGNSKNEGLTLKAAYNANGQVDYSNDQITWVNWVGSPIRYVTSLERLAFECPSGKVPTSIYFEKAGCNSVSNVSTYAWVNKFTSYQYPGCLAGSQPYNDGLSMVAVCRPEPSLARGIWMWIDAGFAAPINNPSDLNNLGGLCPAGYAMTGAYFNAAGCGQTLKYNQALTLADVSKKCPVGAKGPDGKPLSNGLYLRLKCTKYGQNIHECGPFASHNEFPCDDQATCVTNVFGGTRCVCNEGYEGDGRNGTCFAINPCADDENICAAAPGGRCTNTAPGKYQCSCARGYTGDGTPGNCKPVVRTTDSTNYYPNFAAACVFGGRGGNINGNFSFKGIRDGSGNSVGVAVSVRLSGAVSQVARWDVRSLSVDTAETLDACWDAGSVYAGAGTDGFTAKYGKLRSTMNFNDLDIKLWGPTSIVGRSIVLEEKDGDYIGCCTIHLTENTAYSPQTINYGDTPTKAQCDFADGRQVIFTQQRAFVGTDNSGTEDKNFGQSVGSKIQVNPPTLVVSQTFANQAERNVWKQNGPGAPVIETCPNGKFLLGGLRSQSKGAFMDYTFPTGLRRFRQIRVQLTYHALGSWENEWMRVQVVLQNNPAMTMTIWEQKFSGTGACDSTNNRFNVDVVYTLDRPRSNAIIRVTSSLDGDGGQGSESFAISSFKVTLQPINDIQTVRERAFSGSSDLSSWNVIATNGVKRAPVVGSCTLNGATVSLLGGLSKLKTGEILEYKKTASAPFTRLNVKTRFWFNKNWNGNTAIIEMVRPATGGDEVVTLWSRSYTHNSGSSINCDGSSFKDFYVDVDATNAFSRSTTVAWIRVRVTGTLTAPASWSVSSWDLNALPTETSIDAYQDRFRAALAPNWFFMNDAGAKTVVGANDFNYCEGSQTTMSNFFNSGLGSDRVLWGGLNRNPYYARTGLRRFTKAVITFDMYLLDAWENEFGYVSVDGLGIVWKRQWRGLSRQRRRFCRQMNTVRGGYGIHIIESVLLTFPTPQTTIGIKFHSSLNQNLRDESFAVGSLRLTLLPDDQQLRTVTENNNRGFTKGVNIRWTASGGLPLTYPTTAIPTIPQCTMPTEITPAYPANFNRVHDMLGYRQGANEDLRYQSQATSRPFTKAMITFYMWWLDSWNGEYSWLRANVQNPLDTSSPMRYLFRESYHKLEGFVPPFCGNQPYTDFNFPDEVRYRALFILEKSAASKIDLFWGSTLNSPATNEAYAVSRIAYTTFPEVPMTPTVTYTKNLFGTVAGRANFLTNGAAAKIVTCRSETALLGLGAGSSVQYNMPARSEKFNQFRVHFRFYFIGSWDGERATLYANSKEGEWINLWRSDWAYQPDPQTGPNGNRPYYNQCPASGDMPRKNWPYDFYEDVYVEGTFQSATTSLILVWGTTLDQGAADETFAVSHVDISYAPIQTAFLIEKSSFATTGNSLDGFEAQTGGNWGPPVVTPCGPAPQDFLVGGRTRLGPLEKLRWISQNNEVAEPFTVAHIYFRYWFLPTWNAASKATMSVQETGKTGARAQWTALFPFALNQQPQNNPLDCSVRRNMYRDVGFTVTFDSAIRSLTLIWGIDAGNGGLAPRFAISAFRIDVERPYPDWVVQSSCVGPIYRPDDSNRITAGGIFWGLGDMSNKHGPLVKDRTFIDNSAVLHGTYNIIGKTIALYKKGTQQNLGCCRIVQQGPNYQAPTPPAKATAGCAWSNKDTEGYIGFRTPSSTSQTGATVVVWARFYGAEATGRHAYTINYNGFGLPQVQSPNPRCSLNTVGQVFGSSGITQDDIGPHSVALNYGNPNFPGTVIAGVGSSRARIGDLSGKHGTLKDMSPSATDELRYSDGQITFVGPFSIIGRSVVVYSTTGTPLGCCVIGLGPVGSSDNKLDYYDSLGNYTQPIGESFPGQDPFDVPDPELFGALAPTQADTYPYWNAGRIATLSIGCAAALLLIAAILASLGGGGGAGVADAGDGYVAM